MSSTQQTTTPRFWRDPALPFVETREALDGRQLCYAKHSHEYFSIGTITRGRSTYLNEKAREQIAAGTLVLMNPGDVHACNPVDGQLWSYRMFYIDSAWLSDLQHQLGFSHNQPLQPFSAIPAATLRCSTASTRCTTCSTPHRSISCAKSAP